MVQRLIQSGTRQVDNRSIAFRLFKLDGTFMKKVCGKKRDQAMTFEDVETPRGYLVEIPKRTSQGSMLPNSVHLETWDEVVKAGFGAGDEPSVGELIGEVPVVDEDGEVAGSEMLYLQPDPDRKSRSKKVNAHA